jgi:hypothetical protein
MRKIRPDLARALETRRIRIEIEEARDQQRKRDEALLARFRRSTSGQRQPGDDRLIEALADGVNTRERMCTGKKRICTPEHAEELAQRMGTVFSKSYRWYFCPFCRRYHLTTQVPHEKGQLS